jgi:hypothetical protein
MDKKTPELVCGGIYEYTDQHDTVRQGTLVSVTKVKNNPAFGIVHWAGYKPEQILVTSERWGNLKLIGRPAPAVVKIAQPPPPAKTSTTRAKASVGRPRKKS